MPLHSNSKALIHKTKRWLDEITNSLLNKCYDAYGNVLFPIEEYVHRCCATLKC